MDRLTAHAMFVEMLNRGDTDCFPHVMEVQAPDGSFVDAWPAGAVAAVSMAGCLEDAKTDADLLEGLDHFETCISSQIDGFTLQRWEHESAGVIKQFLDWAFQERASGKQSLSMDD